MWFPAAAGGAASPGGGCTGARSASINNALAEPMLPNASHFHLVVAYAAGVLVGLRPISSSASSLTLAEAVSRALAQSGQARQVSLATERAAHEAEQAHSSFRPQVGMNSAAGYSSRQTEKLRAVDGRGVERVYGLASLG